MVEPDVGDDARLGMHEVGSVEHSAHADLDDGDLDGGFAKVRERQRQQCLVI